MRHVINAKNFSIIFLLLLAISFGCQKEVVNVNSEKTNPSSTQTDVNLNASALVLSQTRTATSLNSLNNFRQVYGDQGYPKAKASDVAANDGIYAYTSKLIGINDSAKSFHSNSASSLNLQGFGFTIPTDATILNIEVRLTRFKQGKLPIGDYFISLMQSVSGGPTNGITTYGVMWRNGDVYSGSQYPDSETEYTFSQSGGGNNGWYTHDGSYQWTPAIINLPYFGVRIDSYPPIGRGSVVVYYDLVEITVEYSLPASAKSESSNIGERAR